MNSFFFASFIVAVMYLGDSLSKKINRSYTYVLFFIFIFLTHFYMFGLHAENLSYFQHEISVLYGIDLSEDLQDTEEDYFILATSKKQAQLPSKENKEEDYYEKKRDMHKLKAKKYFKKATDLKLFFPEVEDRDRAMQYYAAIGAMAAPGTPISRLIAGVVMLIYMEGLSVINEWHELQTCLHKAEYHMAMKEFYQEVCEFKDKIKQERERDIEEKKNVVRNEHANRVEETWYLKPQAPKPLPAARPFKSP